MIQRAHFLVLVGVLACSESGSDGNATNADGASSSATPQATTPEPAMPEPTSPAGGPDMAGTSPPPSPDPPPAGGAGGTSAGDGGQNGGPMGGTGPTAGTSGGDAGGAGGSDDPMGPADAGNTGDPGGAGGAAGSGTAGGGGAGGAAGSAGMAASGAAGAGGEPPADAIVAVAEITTTGFDDAHAEVMGTATFTQQGDEVTLVLELSGCPAGPHISHIHVNPSCEDGGDAAGNHWLPNGELITDYSCEDDGTASYTVTVGTDRWTLGADADETDVDGHSFMVHNGSTVSPGDRVACGVIELE